MQHIRITKTATPKCYTVTKDGKPVGYIYLSLDWSRWVLEDTYAQPISQHSSIKAAVNTAKRVLA